VAPWNLRRRAFAAIVALALSACAARPAGAPGGCLVVVIDGLRPDYVTAELMPNLHGLGLRGVVFADHHSVFPTVTRVNAASIATGSYPATHGLLGNSVYVPDVDAERSLDTGEKATLDAIDAATGRRLLTAPSLGELLAASGKRLLALSSGSQGSGFLLNHRAPAGAVIHPDFTVPSELRARIDDALGAGPTSESPVAARTRWIVDALLEFGLEELRPDVTIMWLGTLDTVAHASGVGTPETLEAVRQVDAELGRLEAGLRDRGILDRTNLIVTADHGFSTHVGGFDPDRAIARAVAEAGADPGSVVRAGGAIYVRDADLTPAIVAALQRDPAVGAIFTPAADAGAATGTIAGTLSLDLARGNHPRAGEILVSAAWTDEVNGHGYAGVSTNGGVAGHGATSPFDIHATLIAAGPAFREGLESPVPTGNVDLAPTLLHLLGLPVPETLDGRVIREGLRDGPVPESLEVIRDEHVARAELAEIEYVVTAHTSTVDGHRYLDRVSATRR
jgi:arylsulfatase A-like enzyme